MSWHLSPQHWSADTLFWHLSTDHDIDVYYQVNTGYRPLHYLEKIDISHWFPWGVDGQVDRWTGGQVYIFLGMGLRSCVREGPL